MLSFGKRIALFRKERKMSQTDPANKLGTSVSGMRWPPVREHLQEACTTARDLLGLPAGGERGSGAVQGSRDTRRSGHLGVCLEGQGVYPLHPRCADRERRAQVHSIKRRPPTTSSRRPLSSSLKVPWLLYCHCVA